MGKFSEGDFLKLIDLLTEKKKLADEFLELTCKQAEIIAAEDINALNVSIEKRQQVIEKLIGLHQEIQFLMQSYASSHAAQTEEGSRKVRQMEEQTENAIREAISKNNENAEAIKKQMEYVGQEARKIDLERKSIGMYNNISALTTSELFDKTF